MGDLFVSGVSALIMTCCLANIPQHPHHHRHHHGHQPPSGVPLGQQTVVRSQCSDLLVCRINRACSLSCSCLISLTFPLLSDWRWLNVVLQRQGAATNRLSNVLPGGSHLLPTFLNRSTAQRSSSEGSENVWKTHIRDGRFSWYTSKRSLS